MTIALLLRSHCRAGVRTTHAIPGYNVEAHQMKTNCVLPAPQLAVAPMARGIKTNGDSLESRSLVHAVARTCTLAFFVFCLPALAKPPDFAPAGDNNLATSKSHVAEHWSFEVTLSPFGGDSGSANSFDDIVAKVAQASGVPFDFARKTASGTVVFTSPERLTYTQVLGIRNGIAALDDVHSVRTRRLAGDKAAQQATAPITALGFIVKPRSNVPSEGWIDVGSFTASALATLEQLAGTRFSTSDAMAGGMIALRLDHPLEDDEVRRVQSALASAAFVEWVEPDTMAQAHRIPNDTYYANQWNLWGTWGINAPAAWDVTIGSSNVVVAVIDTGILKTQPDLSSRILPGYDFISNPSRARDGNGPDGDPSDEGDWSEIGDCSPGSPFRPSSWHGSHVAGIVGAASNNGYGVAGVAWGIRILPVRVLGRCGGVVSDIINGMYWAAGLPVPGVPTNPTPARIINMSLGSQTPHPTCSLAYQSAVQAVSSVGAMLVVAAGNNGATAFGDAGYYEPSGCPGVIAVAATDHLGYRALYSNYSNEFVVSLSAPGGDISYYHDPTVGIYSTVDSGLRSPEGPFGAYYNGTSQAAPHVSGILALMFSANPTLTNKQAYLTLIETTREFNSLSTCYRDSVCGWGIANAHAAVLRAKSDPANAPTSASVSSSANPSREGQSFTIWASVSPANVNGTVTFLDNGAPLTGCTNLALNNGSIGCTFAWAANLAGYRLSAVFNGDYTHHWSYSTELIQIVLPSTSGDNYQGLWWNSPAGSESGWGINFAHQGDTIFATWFTYDANGSAWWLVMTAQKTTTNTYSGTLYKTQGPTFDAVPFNPAMVTATPVGAGTLTFTSINTGTFAYTVNSISQTKAITRQAFGPLPTCTFGAQPNLALATNFQDLWWATPAGSESGWGINFAHQGDTIFATWFTYDSYGPLWLVVTAPRTGPGTYSGTLYLTSGPPFYAVPFDPTKVVPTPVGTATIAFTNGNSATFSFSINTSTATVIRTKQITREVFVSPGTVCH